MEYLMMTIHC